MNQVGEIIFFVPHALLYYFLIRALLNESFKQLVNNIRQFPGLIAKLIKQLINKINRIIRKFVCMFREKATRTYNHIRKLLGLPPQNVMIAGAGHLQIQGGEMRGTVRVQRGGPHWIILSFSYATFLAIFLALNASVENPTSRNIFIVTDALFLAYLFLLNAWFQNLFIQRVTTIKDKFFI